MTGMSSPAAAKPESPRIPWMTRFVVSVLSAVTDFSRRSDGTVNRRLLSFLDAPCSPNPKPVRGVRTADLTVDAARDLWIRLFVPDSGSAVRRIPVVVFFHGGGFAYLSAASRAYDAVCRRIARRLPAVVASVDYRLSPEHRWPAPYDDGADVLRFLDSGGLSGGVPAAGDMADLTSVFLVGDSAGANIAHHVARRWAAGEWKTVRVAGLVAIQPFFGGRERTPAETRLAGAPLVSTERTDWLWKAFLPEGADRDHEAVNVFGPAAAKLEENFPPAMVVVGGFDPLQDWQRRYYEGLRARGREAKLVEYPEAIHAFYVFPELKEGAELMKEMKGFVEAHRSQERDGEVRR